MTTTIEAGFGAQITAGGFVLNNELTDFAFEPVIDGRPVANAPGPGKRPLSSQSPVDRVRARRPILRRRSVRPAAATSLPMSRRRSSI